MGLPRVDCCDGDAEAMAGAGKFQALASMPPTAQEKAAGSMLDVETNRRAPHRPIGHRSSCARVSQ